jgi:CHAD domain-containing protein/CYTH domain-containing protein
VIALPADCLRRPPEEGARRVARLLLDEAAAALVRLEDPTDTEALHDFRVNVRRLRSCLRAYRPVLDEKAVELGLARGRQLGRRTNGARDAEVQIEWLEARRPDLARTHRAALNDLLERLLTEQFAAYGRVGPELREDFAELDCDLGATLAVYETVVHLDENSGAPSFGRMTGELLRSSAAELEQHLSQVHSPGDARQAHAARLVAKRLRYVLEPVRGLVDGGKQSLKELRRLQDLLGELNDLAVLTRTLRRALEDAAIARVGELADATLADDEPSVRVLLRRSPENGLLAIVRLVRDRKRQLYTDLAAKWLEGRAQDFFADLERCAERLMGTAVENVEIERKFLLSGLPDRVLREEMIEIDQGWLPGSTVRERLRRTRQGERVRYLRTVKLGQGLKRTEFEEGMESRVFEQLWPLTEGCRVQKQRYRVPEGPYVWEIDVFCDRDLVVAEIELPAEDAAFDIPEWLAPHLVREVTGEPGYSNLELAQSLTGP